MLVFKKLRVFVMNSISSIMLSAFYLSSSMHLEKCTVKILPVASRLYASERKEVTFKFGDYPNSTILNPSSVTEASPSKLPIDDISMQFINEKNLSQDITSMGYYASMCMPTAFKKIINHNFLLLNFMKAFLEDDQIEQVRFLEQTGFSSWLFLCSQNRQNTLVSLSTALMSRDTLMMRSSFPERVKSYMENHVEKMSLVLDNEHSYGEISGFKSIDLVDENWDRIFCLANSFTSDDLLHTSSKHFVKSKGKKKNIHSKFYFIPSFNDVPFPSLDVNYLNGLDQKEYFLYLLKHAHLLLDQPQSTTYAYMSEVYEQMDMELWDNKDLASYIEELMRYHSFCINIDDAVNGMDDLLKIWTQNEQNPPIEEGLMVLDIREYLMADIPSFRHSSLKLFNVLKQINGRELRPGSFPIQEYLREITCREKLSSTLKIQSTSVGFNMMKDYRLSLLKTEDADSVLKHKYSNIEKYDFDEILKKIKEKLSTG
ncbi:MAG: hypothetical protein C0425_11310 [Chlorobiaceae bacterium]|nr:hypothetical protein [Chlorobiaceae bacterium]